MADEYGAPESLDYLSDPNFKGYVTPTFGNVHEFAAWMESNPNKTPETQRLIQAIRTNPDQFEIHGGHFRPKPGFFAKWWPVIVVAAAVAAPAVASALTSGGSAAAGGGASATGGTLASTTAVPTSAAMNAVPASIASQAASAGAGGLLPNFSSVATGALSTVAAPQVALQGASAGLPLAAGAGGAASAAKNFFSNPQNVAKVGGLIPAFTSMVNGGGGSGGGAFNADSDLMKGITEDMGAARKRYQQAGPIYDALINMAYGRTPTQYRGAAPAGYSGDRAPEGGYAFTPPRFG